VDEYTKKNKLKMNYENKSLISFMALSAAPVCCSTYDLFI
jgi:hypothetical protein